MCWDADGLHELLAASVMPPLASGLGCVKTFRSGPKLLPNIEGARSPRHSFIDQDHDDFASRGFQVNRKGLSVAPLAAARSPGQCADRRPSVAPKTPDRDGSLRVAPRPFPNEIALACA